ncbi:MAG: hypothetical protein PHG93_04620 [Candidatus Methanomethylophilaceae archaeon]|jgi:hypothetical protein|nr:hypothetical protein [Candidatus Methanomethylophilaceae archaeon]
MDGHTHAYAATSHTHAYANSQGRVVTDYNHADFRVSGMYGESGAATNTPSGSYKALIVAANSDVGLQITGGYTTDNLYFRGWHSSGGTYTAWRTVLHSGNYNSYAPTKTGTGASGTWGISITGNAATATTASACSGNAATASNSSKLGGLSLGNATQGSHPGANTVVRTDGNGYLNVGWINTVSGSASGTPTRIYCSQDAYLRYYAPDNATLRRSLKAYITYGTAAASGGSSGDIYIKY